MQDEVDELVEAWTRERDDLDLAPVEVFSRISRLVRHLDLARKGAFAAYDMENWEFDCWRRCDGRERRTNSSPCGCCAKPW